MSEVYQADHLAEATGELPNQHHKTGVLAVLAGFCAAIQHIEDDALLLRTERLLSTATGAQLDQYGQLVGMDRIANCQDDDYRRLISAKILANRSTGKPDELIAIAALLLSLPAVGPLYFPLYPAAYSLQCVTDYDPPDGDPYLTEADVRALIREMLDACTPDGVFQEAILAPAGSFAFDSVFAFDDDDDALGFDEGYLGGLL